MKKYFLFPGDFTIYNMEALLEDNKSNNFCWEISKSMDIAPGDIAFLYFHDIT